MTSNLEKKQGVQGQRQRERCPGKDLLECRAQQEDLEQVSFSSDISSAMVWPFIPLLLNFVFIFLLISTKHTFVSSLP